MNVWWGLLGNIRQTCHIQIYFILCIYRLSEGTPLFYVFGRVYWEISCRLMYRFIYFSGVQQLNYNRQKNSFSGFSMVKMKGRVTVCQATAAVIRTSKIDKLIEMVPTVQVPWAGFSCANPIPDFDFYLIYEFSYYLFYLFCDILQSLAFSSIQCIIGGF